MTSVSIIGATGSVGRSVVDVCERHPERFQVAAVAARCSARDLLDIALKLGARTACLASPSSDDRAEFAANGISLLSGRAGLDEIAVGEAEHIVFASSGTDAIVPLKNALMAGKTVSLANKESIVAAGPWIMPIADARPGAMRPVDSEHSAIWQCLRDEPQRAVKRIYLTASGGPFRTYSKEQMKHVTSEQALKHPVWKMGPKITIDSATLMNKGIECIEAMQLFSLEPDRVRALIHPRSLVHGVVEFCDHAMKMLVSRPDMRLPIAAAMAWPDRIEMPDDLAMPSESQWSMEFFEPDEELFPSLRIAREAACMGPAYPPLLIGADSAAVEAFLRGEISFTDIPAVVERTLERWSGCQPGSIEDAIALIDEGTRIASEVWGN